MKLRPPCRATSSSSIWVRLWDRIRLAIQYQPPGGGLVRDCIRVTSARPLARWRRRLGRLGVPRQARCRCQRRRAECLHEFRVYSMNTNPRPAGSAAGGAQRLGTRLGPEAVAVFTRQATARSAKRRRANERIPRYLFSVAVEVAATVIRPAWPNRGAGRGRAWRGVSGRNSPSGRGAGAY